MAAPTAATPKTNPAAPKAPEAAKPGDPAAKPPKVKVERIPYPGLTPDAQGKTTTPLKDYPADYDPKKHKYLTAKDFINEAPLLRHQADQAEMRAKKLRAQADAVEKLGSADKRAKAKKLMRLRETLAKLEAELAGQDIPAGTVG